MLVYIPFYEWCLHYTRKTRTWLVTNTSSKTSAWNNILVRLRFLFFVPRLLKLGAILLTSRPTRRSTSVFGYHASIWPWLCQLRAGCGGSLADPLGSLLPAVISRAAGGSAERSWQRFNSRPAEEYGHLRDCCTSGVAALSPGIARNRGYISRNRGCN